MFVTGSPARFFQVLALALVTLAVPARLFAQAPTFNTFTSTHKGGGDYWNRVGVAAVGDFDGDLKLDAFVTDGSPNLRLMLGNGNGTFAVHYVYTTATSAPVLVRAADLNGDGRLDVVGASGQGDLRPVVLLNTGNVSGVPQFALTTYPDFWSGIRSLTLGDLNGDGRPDFIVGNAYGHLRVYLNNSLAPGTFTAGQASNLTGPNASVGTGVIADLDGDGKTDYVVASSQSPTTNVFFGNGDGTLQAPVEITSNSFKVIVADVNKDGAPDLLEVNGAELRVYLNAGGRTFGSPTPYSTGGSNPSSVATADINGDGNLDAVVANQNSHSVAVLLGNGSGVFGSATVYAVNQVPVDMTVGDFNADGKTDIATSGYNENTYGVLLNTTVFAAPPTVFASGTTTVTTWDPIFPSVAFPYWPSQCSAAPSVGLAANWVNPHAASVFPLGSHPWEDDVPFDFAANWINAWSTLGSLGPAGQSWTKYSTQVTGVGDFVVQFLADNCSWIYLDDQLIGVQDNNWQTNGTGRYPLNLTGTGPHTLSFIIWDGGGAAGGKFRLETRQSFVDGGGDVGGLTPTKGESTTTVSFGVGPFVYTGQPFAATASVSPSGVATIVHSGDCTNAGSSCTATATYAGDANYDGSSATTSITIEPRTTVTTVTFGAGPFVYKGSAFTATASTSPIGTPTVVHTGECTNAGTTCTATATYGGDQNHTGSSQSASITIARAMAMVAATPYDLEYDGQPHTATFTITGVNGEAGPTVGTVTHNTTHTNVGTYADAWSFTGANYIAVGATAITNKIKDTTAPVITSLSTNAPTLWPPNHKMVAITVSALASDLVGVASMKITNVTSSEPDNGLGDGDTAGDIQITGDLTLNLRAERAGKGNGRTYTITVEARDAAANKTTRNVTVFVPKSQGK